jgi:DNA-binding NtrC family response regulator
MAHDWQEKTGAGDFIGVSRGMQEVFALIRKVGPRDSTVLIRGESGTGKERVARAIHEHSPRRDKPFVPVDCTALNDALFESQMFGHEKGSFTGAHRDTLGFIRAAEGGTLFIDELGELSLGNQAKLLRFLQESSVTPVGSVRPTPVDVRVIAATHRDLPAMIDQEQFRLDLFYRLNVVEVSLPPLRERREDIPALVEMCMRRLTTLYREPGRSISDEAVDALCAWDWRGNVRELINAVERAFVLAPNVEIGVEDLPARIRRCHTTDRLAPRPDQAVVQPLKHMERQLVLNALHATQGHQGQAARLIQVERRKFYRMVKRHRLEEHTRG